LIKFRRGERDLVIKRPPLPDGCMLGGVFRVRMYCSRAPHRLATYKNKNEQTNKLNILKMKVNKMWFPSGGHLSQYKQKVDKEAGITSATRITATTPAWETSSQMGTVCISAIMPRWGPLFPAECLMPGKKARQRAGAIDWNDCS